MKDPFASLYSSVRSTFEEATTKDDDDDGVGWDQRVLVVLTDSSGALSGSLGLLCFAVLCSPHMLPYLLYSPTCWRAFSLQYHNLPPTLPYALTLPHCLFINCSTRKTLLLKFASYCFQLCWALLMLGWRRHTGPTKGKHRLPQWTALNIFFLFYDKGSSRNKLSVKVGNLAQPA